MAATPAQKDAAQRLYEVDGYSYKKVAESVGVSMTTVQQWKKKYGWAEKGSKRPVPPGDTMQADDGIPVVVPDIEVGEPNPVAEEPADLTDAPLGNPDYEDEIAKLRAQLSAAEALVAEVRPEIEVPVVTEDNIDDLIPETELRAEAQAEWQWRDNQARRGRMAPPPRPGEPGYDMAMDQILAEKRLERLSGPTAHIPVDLTTTVATKTVKLKHPRMGGEGIVQVVYEPQSNSRTGDLREIMHLFRDKGYRLAMPQRCLLYDCYAPAATIGGNFSNKGFCYGRGHELPFTSGGVITGSDGRIEPGATDVLVGSSHAR